MTEKEKPHPRMLNITDLPESHRRDSVTLMAALRKRYGAGAFLVAVQLNNLTGVIATALNEKNTVLRGAVLEAHRQQAQLVIGEVGRVLGDVLRVSLGDVMAVAHALQDFAQQYENDVMGEELGATEGATKEVLAKVAAQQ